MVTAAEAQNRAICRGLAILDKGIRGRIEGPKGNCKALKSLTT